MDLTDLTFENVTDSIGLDDNTLKQALVNVVPKWARNVLTVYLCVVFFVGLPGNISVIAVQAKNKTINSTDWFVLFLALCDVISLTSCVPFYIMACQGWWQTVGSSAWCKLHSFILHSTNLCSSFIIVCLGIDRYNKTIGIRSTLYFTPKTAKYTGSGMFVVSAIIQSYHFYTSKNNILKQCICDPEKESIQRVFYNLLFLIIAICNVILAVIYTKIIKLVIRSVHVQPITNVRSVHVQPITSNVTQTVGNDTLRRKRGLKITKMIALVTIVFVISSLITVLGAVTLNTSVTRSNPAVQVAVFFLLRACFINNCSNPLFYIWFNPSFREKAFAVCKI